MVLQSSVLCDRFEQDGFAVVESFLCPEEVMQLKREMERIVDECDPNSVVKTVTSLLDFGIEQDRNQYLLDSATNISFFFEERALDSSCNLVVPKSVAFNKVGHCLHLKSEVFKSITFSNKFRKVVKTVAGIKDPAVVQSMYIFKQPKIGGEVSSHIDATFIDVDPVENLIGLWIAIDDATLQNGCLSFIPGSHKKNSIPLRYQRSNENGKLLEFVGEKPEEWFNADLFTPIEVKSGDLILIHGLVVHRSEQNTSDASRHAFTFHIMERAGGTRWSPRNWLQLPEGCEFPCYESQS